MTDIIQSATLLVLAVTCIVQGVAIVRLSKASQLNSQSITTLSQRR